ncbi:MAG: DUF2786 domain-containing protein [Bifidobacteriaceae bacterium]|jgi:hypothetical protein|nr:DUF2786 domain-containing protein [Bifidobacteriaceae bacterium]
MGQHTSRAVIIERVTRLMALSESPHEAEAALAAERATKLMLQWVIDDAELAGADRTEEPVREEVALPGAKSGLFEMFSLLKAVAQAYGCLVFFHRDHYSRAGSRAIAPTATLAGFTAEVASVQRLFATLATVMAGDCRRGWREVHSAAEAQVLATRAALGLDTRVRLSDHGHAAYRRGFYEGFTARIAHRLGAVRAAVEGAQADIGKALVLVGRQERVTAWVDENMNVRTEQIRWAQASAAGWDAGAASGDRAPLGLAQLGGKTRRDAK